MMHFLILNEENPSGIMNCAYPIRSVYLSLFNFLKFFQKFDALTLLFALTVFLQLILGTFLMHDSFSVYDLSKVTLSNS